MLSKERLENIRKHQVVCEGGCQHCAEFEEIEQMARELLALRWKKITPESLPKVGDEVFEFDSKECEAINCITEKRSYEGWKLNRYTHYRPINAPVEDDRSTDETQR